MNISKTIAVIGLITAMVGGAIGSFAVDQERETGTLVFLIGGYLAVIGIIISIFREKVEEKKLKLPALGRKIAATGFGIGSLSGIFNFILHREDIARYLVYFGGFIMVIGILFSTVTNLHNLITRRLPASSK